MIWIRVVGLTLIPTLIYDLFITVVFPGCTLIPRCCWLLLLGYVYVALVAPHMQPRYPVVLPPVITTVDLPTFGLLFDLVTPRGSVAGYPLCYVVPITTRLHAPRLHHADCHWQVGLRLVYYVTFGLGYTHCTHILPSPLYYVLNTLIQLVGLPVGWLRYAFVPRLPFWILYSCYWLFG